MNWKQLVEAQNREIYVLPPGWDSREKVADQLNCSIDNVRVLLAPSIRAKIVETQQFPVWDNITKKVIRVIAYRRRPVSGSKIKVNSA